MSCIFRYVCIGVVLACSLAANAGAEAPRVLPAGQLPNDQRLGPLISLHGYFPFTPSSTREAWQQRAAQLRRQVMVASGVWPMPVKTSSQPVIHGKVERGEYTVEKVYFESYPGFYVTGNLYRPKGRTGKLPAVLSPHGHWPNGRFYDAGLTEVRKQIATGAERFEVGGRYPMQARCVQLARMGCIVFHYDMIGYADSRQLSHGGEQRNGANVPGKWRFFTPQAEARMQTIFGLQGYDSLCALDFLCSLPEVDPTRVAVTGASGGGTQTFVLCAIDPRPAVAFPAVMVSTAMQGGCTCENGSYLRIGTGNVELAGLFAPKPLGMTAADDWTKEIATKGLPQLKQLYALFGASDLVMAKPLVQFPHNYNYVSRAVMYAWLNKHLKLGLKEPIIEEDFRPLSVAEMSVWDEQHPAPPRGPQFEQALLERITADTRRQIESLTPTDADSLQEYRRIVGGAAQVMIGRGLPDPTALQVVDSQRQDLGECRMARFLLRNQARGAELPVVQLEPKNWNHRVVIWVDRLGKQAMFEPSGSPRPGVQTLLNSGFVVVAADLFEQGEFTPDGKPLAKARMGQKPGSSTMPYAGLVFGYNLPLFSQRVDDLLSLVAFVRSDKFAAAGATPAPVQSDQYAPAGDTPIPVRVDVVGLHGAGHWVAAARAIAASAIDRAALDTAGFRYANLTAIDDPDFLPGGAKYGDLPGMIALSAPYPLWLSGEESPAPSPISEAYRAAGRPESLNVWQGKAEEQEAAAIAWLVKNAR
jgi:dienelactone hydrolase